MSSTASPQVSRRPPIKIAARPYDHLDVQTLVWALFDEQVERYGYADPAEAEAGKYAPPRGLFLVGYLDGRAVTGGGYRTYDLETRTVEIKKMYTCPDQRKRGLGRTMLTELEHQAARAGAKRSILETGIRNTGALALYASMGYVSTSTYMDNRDPDINRAFIKDLV
jgi:GNAT superfamily N-acetyltransferase